MRAKQIVCDACGKIFMPHQGSVDDACMLVSLKMPLAGRYREEKDFCNTACLLDWLRRNAPATMREFAAAETAAELAAGTAALRTAALREVAS